MLLLCRFQWKWIKWKCIITSDYTTRNDKYKTDDVIMLQTVRCDEDFGVPDNNDGPEHDANAELELSPT